jgi:predicted phosphodiesterase
MLLTLLSFSIAHLKRFQFFNKYFLVCLEENKNLCSLPPEWHVNLTLDKKTRKVLFIGDVHGCHDELTELLEKAGVHETDDILVIFVGDICNKGPKNIETIRLVRQMGSMAYSVRGNHEQAVLYRLKQFDETAELPPKYSWVTELSTEDQLFLEHLPFTISIQSLNVIVVHGGLVPGIKLSDQKPRDMISIRNYVHEKLSGSSNIDVGLPWGSQWPGPQFVIFGHDARRRLQRHKHAIGLDTGCLYGFKLTGYMVNVCDENPMQNGQFISVDSNSTYVKP